MKSDQLYMKLLLAALLFVAVQSYVIAVEEVLIDFSLLAPDTPVDNPVHDSVSLLGFKDLYPTATGISLSKEERDLVQVSLAIPEWKYIFNSSARRPSRIRASGLRAVVVAPQGSRYAGADVLGMRFDFQEGDANSWVLVEPPYTIPRVPQEFISGTAIDFSQRGVIANVAQIQSISAEVYGLNYPHRVSVLYADVDGTIKERFLGYLDFEGWRTLTWENPHYVSPSVSVSNAPEAAAVNADDATAAGQDDTTANVDTESQAENAVNKEPTYPSKFPSIALRGIRVWKNGSRLTGDFVGYLKEIRVNYDPISIIDGDGDFDNEQIWQVNTEKARDESRRRQIREAGSGRVYEIIINNTK